MRVRLPPLDTHAHINPRTSPADLEGLSAAIFAMTRSLEEATLVKYRADTHVVWAVGCHPGVVRAQKAFDASRFADLLRGAAAAGELGLDGTSAVAMDRQREVLRAALSELVAQPRIVSLHSHRAQASLLDELERTPVTGSVLHWWLGSAAETKRAVELGCYFSVNAMMVARPGALDAVPPDRILTETDHPYGDRKGPAPRLPGRVENVEAVLARRWGVEQAQARVHVWQNFARLVGQTSSGRLLPRAIRTHIVALP